MNNIKIIVAYHKESSVYQSNVYIPIHVGAKISNIKLPFIRDDSGVNISERNESYCELTAIYWSWKNLDTDFIGFMHYRRFLFFNSSFLFNLKRYFYNFGRLIHSRLIINKILNMPELFQFKTSDFAIITEELRKSEKIIPLLLQEYDAILPKKEYLGKKVITQYAQCHDEVDLKIFYETAGELYPELGEYIYDSVLQRYLYPANMFVMRRVLFQEYCEFLFNILFEVEKKININEKIGYQRRVIGFLAERFMFPFIEYKKHTSKIKVKEVDIILFQS